MTLRLADLKEAFPGRFVTEIIDELNRLEGSEYPEGLLRDVLEAGAYREAWHQVTSAETRAEIDRLPKSPLIELVKELILEPEEAEEES